VPLPIEPYRYLQLWNGVLNQLKHRRRFFSGSAKELFTNLFEGVENRTRWARAEKDRNVVWNLPQGRVPPETGVPYPLRHRFGNRKGEGTGRGERGDVSAGGREWSVQRKDPTRTRRSRQKPALHPTSPGETDRLAYRGGLQAAK
jgi:hypothetical protein